MTAEEIEIIVTAKIEEALKEFNKIVPAIKEEMKQVQEAFSKIDAKEIKSKVQQATNFAKKKIQDLKKSSENSKIAIKVNNKEASKQVTQLEKEIDSLQKKITGRQLKLDVTNTALDKIRNDTNQSVIKEMPDAGNKKLTQETYSRLDKDINYQALVKQSDKLNNEIEKYNTLLNSAKTKMTQLGQQTSKTATIQNKLSSFFSAFKQKIEQAKTSAGKLGTAFKQMPKTGRNITNSLRGMGGSLKAGLGQIFKIAGALFGLQTIYSTLRSAASTWLSSQNSQAKQLSDNIDYMKYALGSTLAPVIQFVTNLVYQLMKAIQSVAYALTGVNIFAKASAKAYSSMAKSAKKAKNETKSLSNIHSEINNVQSNDNSDSGSGESTSPSFDLGSVDGKLMSWAEKIKEVLAKLFEPMQNAWNNHGQALMDSIRKSANKIRELFNDVGRSFSEVWLNGTGERTCTIILQIITIISDTIGIITEKWKNAWENNNNGTQMIQNLADTFNNVLDIVLSIYDTYKKWWETEQAQNFVNAIVQGFETISSVIEKATEIIKNIWEGAGRDTFTSLLDTVSKVIEFVVVLCDTLEPFATSIMEVAAPAIELIVKLIGDWLDTIRGLLDFWIGVFTGDWSRAWEGIKTTVGSELDFIKDLIKLAYEFIIGMPVKMAEKVIKAAEELGEKVGEKVGEIKDNFVNKFNEMKDNAVNKVTEIKDGIKNKFQEAYNGITSVFGRIENFFSGIWNGIKNTFSRLGTNIGDAISGAVKSGINGVISLIERTINSAIRLINGGIGMINLIPGVSVGTINTLNLPRLAKGNVAYDETLAIFGEYSGANNNPEITTPQNIMRDTFEDVLSDFNSGNGQPLHVTIQYLGKEIFDDTIDYINSKTRRTGKNTIVTVGD